VSHDHKLLRIQTVLIGLLAQKLVRAANVGKSIGPSSSFIAHAAILEVCCSYAFGSESGAKVARMIQAVLGSPKASVDIDDCRVRPF
jgi:hypothetical protein